MRFRQLGASGLTVSVIGLGGNNFGTRCTQAQTTAVVRGALDAGITFIDTAPAYGGPDGSELMLGQALKGQRQRVVLATKFGFRIHNPDIAPGSRRNIRREVEDSLRRLGTDYIDLYYLHHVDPLTPIEETLLALHELVHEGKVLYVGACNMAAWQLVEAEWTARSLRLSRFVAAQNLYNLLDRSVERDLVPVCQQYDVGLVPYSPLANGLLTGKYRRGIPPPEGARLAGRPEVLSKANFDSIERFESFAAERGLSPVQVGLAGLLAQPAVASVLVGATSVEQVAANAAAAEVDLSVEDLALLETTPLA
ncbi:MAG: aldo/keto reductase [Chloroflexi bacterium]|nr:aldo/keto reductase [Chloroflexota bacterium]